MHGARHDKAHSSLSSLSSVSLSGDLPSVSLGPVRVLLAQLPTRGLPRLARSRASPRPALWVQGLGGTASERITTLYLDSNGTGLGKGPAPARAEGGERTRELTAVP